MSAASASAVALPGSCTPRQGEEEEEEEEERDRNRADRARSRYPLHFACMATAAAVSASRRLLAPALPTRDSSPRVEGEAADWRLLKGRAQN